MYLGTIITTTQYCGSYGLTQDRNERLARAETLDALYEIMGKEKTTEEDHGGGEWSRVSFGPIYRVSETLLSDPERITASQAYQRFVAAQEAEKAAEEAEEREEEERRAEAYRKAKIRYVLSYSDHMYPEDNRIIGIFDTEEKAEQHRDEECAAWRASHGQQNHHANPHYYDISEHETV